MQSFFSSLIFFILLIAGRIAHAYIPPTFYLAEKIAKTRSTVESALLQYELLKPSTSKSKTTKNSDTLWIGSIAFPDSSLLPPTNNGGWFLITMLLESRAEKILTAWRNFGLLVHSERDLVQKKGKYDKNTSPDSPFYRFEENTSIRRYGRDSHVIQITGSDQTKKIYLDKHSFKPIAIFGPCPESFSGGSMFRTSQGDQCSLEFSYEENRFSIPLPTKISFKIGERELLIMKINRLILNPGKKVVSDLTEKQSDLLSAADELVQGFHNNFLH